MKIIFVRHGHPDYVKDCLTELGREQAIACAERLTTYGISSIYSSTCGRAFETASCTAQKTGLSVIPLEFMREIHWGKLSDSSELYHDGHPWDTAEYIYSELGIDLKTSEWREHPYFKDNIAMGCCDKVSREFTEWMLTQGYSCRDGKWFCERENLDTVAIFSHGGSGSAAISRLLGWEFPYTCLTVGMNYTSITVIDVPSSAGHYSLPRILKMNDDLHVKSEKTTFEM